MQRKAIQIISLTLAVLMSSAACSTTATPDASSAAPIKLSMPAETVKATEKPIISNNNKKVAEIYGSVLDNIKSYKFNDLTDVPVTYTYALVLMNESDIPQLLVAQDTNYGISNIKTFSVNSDFTKEITSDDICTVGVAPAGGFRGSISQNEECNALLYSSWLSGTGAGVNEEITAVTKNDNLQIEKKTTWEGTIDNAPVVNSFSINFVDIADRQKLEKLASTPDGDFREVLIATNKEEAAKEAAEKEAEKEEQLYAETRSTVKAPTEKMCVSGVVKVFTHSELLKFQDVDPALLPDLGEEYVVLVLKSPVDITVHTGDHYNYSRVDYMYPTQTVNLIGLPDNMRAYDGQNMTISFSADDGHWQTDCSLPMNAPRMHRVDIVK